MAVVQTLLKPMRTVGSEMSEFIRALVRDLPVQWQLFSVLAVFGLFVLLLFLACGLRIPFLLAIEPSRPPRNVSTGQRWPLQEGSNPFRGTGKTLEFF